MGKAEHHPVLSFEASHPTTYYPRVQVPILRSYFDPFLPPRSHPQGSNNEQTKQSKRNDKNVADLIGRNGIVYKYLDLSQSQRVQEVLGPLFAPQKHPQEVPRDPLGLFPPTPGQGAVHGI